MRRPGTLLATLALASLVPNGAFAYECFSTDCALHCEALTYRIGNIPSSLDEAATIASIQRAFDAWGDPACSMARATYAGARRPARVAMV